jgi:hypothetical protein
VRHVTAADQRADGVAVSPTSQRTSQAMPSLSPSSLLL